MSKNKRTSRIWTMPINEFKSLMKSSASIAEVLRHFGYVGSGRAHKMIKQRCKEDNVDISHIPMGIGSNKGKQFIREKIPLKDILIKQSTYNRGHLKKRLLSEGLLENKCSICGLGPEWNDQPLVMRIDHINGVNDDHRLKNLRLVCPNCDSQLPTFSGRNCK